jgi:hypothetical protein
VVGVTQQNQQPVIVHEISPDYTRALGIAMVQGRLFEENEVNSKQQLAIVNQNFVKNRLDGQNALGRVIRIPPLKQPPSSLENDSFQVIGVVKIRSTEPRRSDGSRSLHTIHRDSTGRPDCCSHKWGSCGDDSFNRQPVYAIDKDQPVTG